MIEAHDHWVLLLIEGYQVAHCPFEHYDFCLDLLGPRPDDIYRLWFGTFTYRGADGLARVLHPDNSRQSLAPALAEYGLTVEVAVAHKSGRLDLAFSDGSVLTVEVDPNFEAWDLSGPRGFLVVSIPGGDLAIWSEQ
jgi:Family of unknown function (DUF6188)